jgi:pullulanase/glycogen debranching enzyme
LQSGSGYDLSRDGGRFQRTNNGAFHPSRRTVPPRQHLRGRYAGLAHPASIDYLTSLGVTAVELLPVHQFVHEKHLIEKGLRNYWGYHSYGFFAPHKEYASVQNPIEVVREFKGMVKLLHEAGLEVILDVVYNHTGEGNHLGPMLSFRGSTMRRITAPRRRTRATTSITREPETR